MLGQRVQLDESQRSIKRAEQLGRDRDCGTSAGNSRNRDNGNRLMLIAALQHWSLPSQLCDCSCLSAKLLDVGGAPSLPASPSPSAPSRICIAGLRHWLCKRVHTVLGPGMHFQKACDDITMPQTL
jgi:hypothetical protein